MEIRILFILVVLLVAYKVYKSAMKEQAIRNEEFHAGMKNSVEREEKRRQEVI